jgi:hypothetical protein
MRDSHVDVATQLKVLAGADRSTLLALWIDRFGALPAFRAHRDLLALILAYRLQEQTEGGLSQGCRRRLRALAEQFKKGKSPTPARARLGAGTRLIREWRGQTHVVSVLDDAVEYRSKRYGSLSEVARAITGTRWSGPAFFGLKSTKSPSAEAG